MKTQQPTERVVTKSLMKCPACEQAIEAEITVSLQVGELDLTDLAVITATVTPGIERFRLTHPCHGRTDARAEA